MLTVLLITYNHKDYFRKAIESVLAQKTDFNFIIEVHDDASTDGTSDLVREYAQKYPNKIVANIHEKNIGVIENGYRALSNVKTKYFATLETDDYWCDDTKLQQQVDALEKNLDCSFCGHVTHINDLHNPKEIPFRAEKTTRKITFPKKFDLEKYRQVHPSSRVYRTGVIDFKSLKNKMSVVRDTSVFLYYLSKGKLYYIDKVMSVYNITYQGVYTSANRMSRHLMGMESLVTIYNDLGSEHRPVLEEIFDFYITSQYDFIKKDNHFFLFGLIPLFAEKSYRTKVTYKLFGFIPFLKIKRKKLYLFNFIWIGCLKEVQNG